MLHTKESKAIRLYLGIDIGKTTDPTAVALTEQVWRPVPEEERIGDASPAFRDHYYVRHLERLDLGTDYPEILRALVQIWRSVRDMLVERNRGSGQGRPTVPQLTVYVDATGVGVPVVDFLLEAGVPVIGCYFTHGDKRTELVDARNRRYVSLGKAYTVSRLQALLQTGRIHLPRTREARAMAKELLDFEIKVDQNANDKYGAFKVGTHDDYVTALGLTVQEIAGMVLAAQAAGGFAAAPAPSFGRAPTPLRTREGGVPVVQGGLNNWGALGGNGLDRYSNLDEVYRLTKRREGFTP